MVLIINTGKGKIIALKAQKQYPLVLHVKLHYKQDEALGSEVVRVMENGLQENF